MPNMMDLHLRLEWSNPEELARAQHAFATLIGGLGDVRGDVVVNTSPPMTNGHAATAGETAPATRAPRGRPRKGSAAVASTSTPEDPAGTPAEDENAPEPLPEKETLPAEAKRPTEDDVRAALNRHVERRDVASARRVLKNIGGHEQLAEIPPSRYAAIIEALGT